MKRFDPVLASPFRVQWLEPLDATAQDDYTRAVAEKAEALLRSARFIDTMRVDEPHDLEVRVWVEAACGNACVSITWEPGAKAFGFHLLDETCRERIACIVFEAIPCVDAGQSEAQFPDIVEAMRRLRVDGPD